MKLMKVLLVAVVMLSGVIVPPNSGDDPIPTPFCYGSDCTCFW